MKQIVIGNYRVDPSRCEVHRETDTVSLEPKVVQVLLYLAKHQGEVVSHQALLDEIWPDTIVEANALQRCIGQLRKAFRDDAKQQQVIATYPKNGYSLLLKVQWEILPTPQWRSRIVWPALITASVVIIALFLLQPTTLPPEVEGSTQMGIELAELEDQPVDFYAVYSPDGLYVVYPRLVEEDSVLRNLWIQDIANNEEFLLSSKPGMYEDVAWSLDSQNIALVEAGCIGESCLTTQCSALKLLSAPFTESHLNNPVSLIDCLSSHLQSPQWTSSSSIVLVEKNDTESSVIKYSLDLSTSEALYQQAGISPLHLAYSKATDRLAITMHDGEKQYLVLLSMGSEELITIHPALPENIMNEPWYPIWNLQNDGLLISSTEGNFNIGLDGSVSKQDAPFIPAIN